MRLWVLSLLNGWLMVSPPLNVSFLVWSWVAKAAQYWPANFSQGCLWATNLKREIRNMEGNYTDNNCLGPSIIIGNATQYWLASLQQRCFWEPNLKRRIINIEENFYAGSFFFFSCDNVQQKSKYWQCCTLAWVYLAMRVTFLVWSTLKEMCDTLS